MITNKKGLSDIVTTALIILLVAVSVAAIWAFVSPALRGTGTQFTKTQVCVSNIIESLTCKTTVDTANAAGKFPVTVQVRRTLTDGVAVPSEFETTVGTSPTFQKQTTNDKGTKYSAVADPSPTGWTGAKIPRDQGQLISLTFETDADSSGPVPAVPLGASPQAQVTTTYKLPDNTIVKCASLPITCNVA